MNERPYTVATLAQRWGCSDTFIYDQIKAERLQAMRFGGKLLRIKPEAVEEYECRATLGASDASPESGQTDRPTGTGASSGLTNEDRTAFRLARRVEPQPRPRLASSGHATASQARTR